jgi:mRNA interferase YafQ
MRAIDSTTKFKQDFKRELRGKYKKFLETSFESVLTKLAMDQKLEPKYRDHSLILVRLGSHSELAL